MVRCLSCVWWMATCNKPKKEKCPWDEEEKKKEKRSGKGGTK